MAESVTGDVFIDGGQFSGFSDCRLEGALAEVVAAFYFGTGVSGYAGGGKDVLPDPLVAGVGVLVIEGVGEEDGTAAGFEVLFVDHLDAGEVFLEGLDQDIGEDGSAVAHAFPVANEDEALVKVDVLDTESHTFHEAEAGAVEEFGHELVGLGEGVEEVLDFFLGEDGGEAFGSFGAGSFDGQVELDFEDIMVEEDDGAEGLVLSGGGDFTVDGQVGEEGFDLLGAHGFWVAFVMK
jgi:hypothetical protein